jgi:RNA polymerase sigma-70 factor (ECF subfamily)
MGLNADRSDAALWLAGRTDPDAFGELYERHARAVFALCARRTGDIALADDLTSIVFLEAWRRRRSVTLSGPSALPWLLGTAVNVSRNSQRSLRRYRTALRRLPRDEIVATFEDDAIEYVDAQHALAETMGAIAQLPEIERDVVMLVLSSGLSYADAAQALGVPIGTVRSRLARARIKLGDLLTDKEADGDDREGGEMSR